MAGIFHDGWIGILYRIHLLYAYIMSSLTILELIQAKLTLCIDVYFHF
jgi:hypothetical protein